MRRRRPRERAHHHLVTFLTTLKTPSHHISPLLANFRPAGLRRSLRPWFDLVSGCRPDPTRHIRLTLTCLARTYSCQTTGCLFNCVFLLLLSLLCILNVLISTLLALFVVVNVVFACSSIKIHNYLG